MLIFPAIDIKDGTAVRLRKGDFSTVHRVSDDPVKTAEIFKESGAEYLHMVDLDGAREGVRKNGYVVRAVAKIGIKVELGGGIRTMKDLEEVFSLGVWRGVIGSAAVSDPEFVKEAVKRFGKERIAVGIDAKDGVVRTSGWERSSGLEYLTFARSMEAIGVRHIIFTDIDSDGMLTGPSFERLKALQEAVGCDITASGGVGSDDDVRALSEMGLYAAIIGKAWYAGKVDLKRAVEYGKAKP